MTWTSAPLRRLSLWLLCAMLLAALAPTVSRARAWSQGSAVPWMVVCATEGTPQTALKQQGITQRDEASVPGAALLDHVALCVLASECMAPPPSPLSRQALASQLVSHGRVPIPPCLSADAISALAQPTVAVLTPVPDAHVHIVQALPEALLQVRSAPPQPSGGPPGLIPTPQGHLAPPDRWMSPWPRESVFR